MKWTEPAMKEEGCVHWECALLLARSCKDEQVSKVTRTKCKTAFHLRFMWSKGRHCGTPHEKVGNRARTLCVHSPSQKNRYLHCMDAVLFFPARCGRRIKTYGR